MGYLAEIANKIKNGERVERIVDSISGTKGVSEANIRIIDELTDSEFLDKMKEVKKIYLKKSEENIILVMQMLILKE